MNQTTQGSTPSHQAYAELQEAYDHFNSELFDGKLPSCLITYARKKRTMGYLSKHRFVNKVSGERVSELAMNPTYFAIQKVEEIMQTLVHEMAHQWQDTFGKPGRRGYHNKEWADKMEAIGLMPSDTGREGGKRTGEHMSDYVIPGGLFEQSCNRLLSQRFRISWLDRYPARATPSNSPDLVISLWADHEDDSPDDDDDEALSAQAMEDLGISVEEPDTKRYQKKYRCVEHKLNVWGKPGLKVACGTCLNLLEEV